MKDVSFSMRVCFSDLFNWLECFDSILLVYSFEWSALMKELESNIFKLSVFYGSFMLKIGNVMELQHHRRRRRQERRTKKCLCTKTPFDLGERRRQTRPANLIENDCEQCFWRATQIYIHVLFLYIYIIKRMKREKYEKRSNLSVCIRIVSLPSTSIPICFMEWLFVFFCVYFARATAMLTLFITFNLTWDSIENYK